MAPSVSRLQRDLATRLLDLLRHDAVAPGTRLTELGLARRLQVSRTPVRAVLDEMARRGIAERRPGGGFLLRSLPAPEAAAKAGEAGDDIDRLCIRIAGDRVAGRLPGEVSEADLMRRYGVSRPFLLRVLGRLAEIAMIERKPGHGWSFLPTILDGKARGESFAFRLLLEPAALLCPGFGLPPGWAAEMRRRHEAVLSGPWKTTDSVMLFEMNAAFHEGLVAGAGNRYLLLAVQQQNRLRRFLNYDWSYGFDRVVTSCTEHLEILARVERGEMDVASLLMRHHLERASRLPRLD
jgi:DNA-binding GntR family transcriptional regulator